MELTLTSKVHHDRVQDRDETLYHLQVTGAFEDLKRTTQVLSGTLLLVQIGKLHLPSSEVSALLGPVSDWLPKCELILERAACRMPGDMGLAALKEATSILAKVQMRCLSGANNTMAELPMLLRQLQAAYGLLQQGALHSLTMSLVDFGTSCACSHSH